MLGKHVGHRYNKGMDKTTIDNLKVQPDQKTGKKATKKQMELLLILNPFEFNRTYADAAEILGVSESNIQTRMSEFKKRCPAAYEKFMKVKESLS